MLYCVIYYYRLVKLHSLMFITTSRADSSVNTMLQLFSVVWIWRRIVVKRWLRIFKSSYVSIFFFFTLYSSPNNLTVFTIIFYRFVRIFFASDYISTIIVIIIIINFSLPMLTLSSSLSISVIFVHRLWFSYYHCFHYSMIIIDIIVTLALFEC
jgi:hypothetical protein